MKRKVNNFKFPSKVKKPVRPKNKGMTFIKQQSKWSSIYDRIKRAIYNR